MGKIREFVNRWPAHIVASVVLVVVLAILSVPEASSSVDALVSYPVDLAKRLMYAWVGIIAGYWVSRMFLQKLYKARDTLSASSLIWFEALRLGWVGLVVLAVSLWSA